MIRRNLIKTFAFGLCMSALFAGGINTNTAFAQSIGGETSAYGGAVSYEDKILFETQAEMDQFLFVKHVKEIEAMGFKVIYTGVADTYVEVGITPYKQEYADFIYDEFDSGLVKVVDAEAAVTYSVPKDAPDVMPVGEDNEKAPEMDMGDTAVSDIVIDDEALIKERERTIADDEEMLSIQITSVDLETPSEDMDPELIWQTGIADLPEKTSAEEPTEDGTDIKLVSAEDNMATTSAAADVENVNKGLPTLSIVAVVAAGLLIIGGITYTSVKKRSVKKN